MFSRLRIAFVLALASGAAAAIACSSSDGGSSSGSEPDASDRDTGETPPSSSPPGQDGGTDSGKDAAVDAPAKDANGPGEAGAPCSFNRDCALAFRCECTEVDGCGCAAGPRGTGRNGIDPCDGGNQCASSVCVEGPASVFYCSDECVTAAECTGPLPQCTDIAFVGRICIRDGGM